VKAFRPYVQYLESLVTLSPQEQSDWKRRATFALNGEPGRELARRVSLETRRRVGAFFTGATLAQQAIARTAVPSAYELVFDPACGVGDLLLAVARFLPVRASLRATLELWGAHLAGCDTHSEFVRAAKARLVLLALRRGARMAAGETVRLDSIFCRIRVGDGLQSTAAYSEADWVVLNPPYGYVEAPKDCEWASGRTTEAAIFFQTSLLNSPVGTRITAILPEVLRSGTRYEKWRQMVGEHSVIKKIMPYGLFDRTADIDVFILDVVKHAEPRRSLQKRWIPCGNQSDSTVGDLFDVHVGAVVPHRHRQAGPVVPYIHARATPPWARVETMLHSRRFAGSLFRPPFVVIRRTSRPEDTHRAVGTIITSVRSVAIENHLIVCSPRDGTVKSCRSLLRLLRTPSTSNWLNSRIRCRHLTVKAVRELPMTKRG
jgi:hypothetical protein